MHQGGNLYSMRHKRQCRNAPAFWPSVNNSGMLCTFLSRSQKLLKYMLMLAFPSPPSHSLYFLTSASWDYISLNELHPSPCVCVSEVGNKVELTKTAPVGRQWPCSHVGRVIYTTVLFTVAKYVHQWEIKELWYTHTMKNYLSLKKCIRGTWWLSG